MRIITKDEFFLHIDEFEEKVEDGAVFVYPTDTIYGIGCDATNDRGVERIRELKDRSGAPFSVIAPSIDWIRENCEIGPEAKEWIEKLPGPYTLILPLKRPDCVAPSVTKDGRTLGVRMPKHWIRALVRKLDIPLVTTSVNKTGKSFMRSVDDMDNDIKMRVSFIIDEGPLEHRPSNIIDLAGATVTVMDRSK